MDKKMDQQTDKISEGCQWLMVAVILLLALACCVGIVAFAVWINV